MSSRNLNIGFTSEIAKETKQVEVGEGLGLEADPYNFLVYGWGVCKMWTGWLRNKDRKVRMKKIPIEKCGWKKYIS